MNKRLRVIHLDDDLISMSLCLALLVDEDFECDIMRVETEEDFRALLQSRKVDLVLAELTFPAFSGMSALAITRAKYPDLPFIFVTGSSGEEIAIECLKSGASDYVLKGRLSRLVPAVQRALRDVDERQKLRRRKRHRDKRKFFQNANQTPPMPVKG